MRSHADSAPAGAVASPTTEYLVEARDSFDEAVEKAGLFTIRKRIAARSLTLLFAGRQMHDAIAPAFGHLPDEPDGSGESTICAWDAASSGVSFPVPPWRPRDVRELGVVRGFNDERFKALHDTECASMTLVDREIGLAVFQLQDVTRLPWYERAAPFRSAIHWLMASHGSGLVHAGVVGSGGSGVLVAGRGGRGKTTLAAAAVLHGLDVAGDDYTLIRFEDATVAYSVHSTFKATDETLVMLPELAGSIVAPAHESGTKHVIDIGLLGPGSMVDSMRIRGIVLPARSSGAPAVRRVSGGEALKALAPSTLFQLPAHGSHAFRDLALLAADVPCHVLETGDDVRTAAVLLEELIDNLR